MHHENPELLAAVTERVELGYTNEQIHTELAAAGYDDETIDLVIKKVQQTAIPIPPAAGQLIPVGELVSGALDITKQQARVFLSGFRDFLLLFLIGAIALFAVVMSVTSGSDNVAERIADPVLLYDLEYSPVFLIVLFLVVTVFGILSRLISFAMQRTIILRNDPINSYLRNLQWSVLHIFSIIWIGILVGLVSQLGFVLLVLPGIAVSIYLIFASYILASGQGKGLSALIASMELVYGRWWGVFGRLIVLYLVALLCALVAGIGVVVISTVLEGVYVPLGVLVMCIGFLAFMIFVLALVISGSTLLFESLKQTKTHRFSTERIATLKTVLVIAAVLGFVAVVITNIVQESEQTGMGDVESMYQTAEVIAIRQELATMPERAEAYAATANGSYEGVCAELVSVVMEGERPDCADTADHWALAVAVPSGGSYCIDSETEKAFAGNVQAANTTCLVDASMTAPDTRERKDWAQELRDEMSGE